jgi:hypothetical protein
MKLSPVLHLLAAATMKSFLALTFLAALSLAVSLFRLIRFTFMYHKGLQQGYSIHLSESSFLFVLFYVPVTTNHKSHKAIYHTELLSAYTLVFKYFFLFSLFNDGIAVYMFKFLHHLEMSLGIDVLDTG